MMLIRSNAERVNCNCSMIFVFASAWALPNDRWSSRCSRATVNRSYCVRLMVAVDVEVDSLEVVRIDVGSVSTCTASPICAIA